MPEFPSRMLFRPIMLCPRVATPPLDGTLSGLEHLPALPPLSELDGRDSFARVWVAWNEEGLFIAGRFPKPTGTVAVNRRRPHSGDGLQVWVDTRATQTAHRASRFCHHFVLLPKGGGAARSRPVAWQNRIRRAREHAPVCDPDQIRIASLIGDGYYTIEAHLPASVLTGFEAREGARLGFNYLAHDVPAGRQLWASAHGFPSDTDPSLWGLIELGG